MKMGAARVRAVYGAGAPGQPKEGSKLGASARVRGCREQPCFFGKGGAFYQPGRLPLLGCPLPGTLALRCVFTTSPPQSAPAFGRPGPGSAWRRGLASAAERQAPEGLLTCQAVRLEPLWAFCCLGASRQERWEARWAQAELCSCPQTALLLPVIASGLVCSE